MVGWTLLASFAPQGWRLELRGVQGGATQWARLKQVGQTLEKIGYDSLWLYDHFHTVPRTEIATSFASPIHSACQVPIRRGRSSTR